MNGRTISKRSPWSFFEFYVASHTSPHEPRVLRTFFEKKRLAMLPEIYALLGTTSRMTVFRRLRSWIICPALSHVGRYYTLPCVANFDPQGLWFYEEIGFSGLVI